MEHIPQNFFEKGGDYGKGIKDIENGYISKISEIKNLCKFKEQFDSLIDGIKAESAVVLIQIENILKSSQDNFDKLLPETKLKIDTLFDKSKKILDKVFELSSARLDNKAFDVWEKQTKFFYDSVNQLEDKDMAEKLKEIFSDSMDKLFGATSEQEEKIASLYQSFLNSYSEENTSEIKEFLNNDEDAEVIATNTQKDHERLLDNFIENCNLSLNNAKQIYIKEQISQN